MQAFNRSLFEYFTCLNHTIHLAVLAALFSKKGTIHEEEFYMGAEDIDIPAAEHFFMKEIYSEIIERMAKIVRFSETRLFATIYYKRFLRDKMESSCSLLCLQSPDGTAWSSVQNGF